MQLHLWMLQIVTAISIYEYRPHCQSLTIVLSPRDNRSPTYTKRTYDGARQRVIYSEVNYSVRRPVLDAIP